MKQYKFLFNLFYLLGLCPFYISKDNEEQESAKFPRFFITRTLLITIATLSTYAYVFIAEQETAQPTRVEISYVTSTLAVGTITLDYLVLKVLLMIKYKIHRDLFYELLSIKDILRLNSAQLIRKDNQSERSRSWKWISIETVIKSICLLLIPLILLGSSGIATVLATASFFAMFYTILYQFIYSRVYLVILNESIDGYLNLIEIKPNSRPLSIVDALKGIYGGLSLYNRVFKFHNLIVIKCAFVILVMLLYFATILMAISWLAMFLVLPIALHIGYDVTALITLCHKTTGKINKIKKSTTNVSNSLDQW